jgi:hypothetical protein
MYHVQLHWLTSRTWESSSAHWWPVISRQCLRKLLMRCFHDHYEEWPSLVLHVWRWPQARTLDVKVTWLLLPPEDFSTQFCLVSSNSPSATSAYAKYGSVIGAQDWRVRRSLATWKWVACIFIPIVWNRLYLLVYLVRGLIIILGLFLYNISVTNEVNTDQLFIWVQTQLRGYAQTQLAIKQCIGWTSNQSNTASHVEWLHAMS